MRDKERQVKGMDEDICCFLENITIEELEKLIVVDNLTEIEQPAIIGR